MVAQWSGVDLLSPRGCAGAPVFGSRLFVEEFEEGGDVEEAHLRGAGVGGITAFFGAFCSSSVEDQKQTMIHHREKMSKDYSHVTHKGKILS